MRLQLSSNSATPPLFLSPTRDWGGRKKSYNNPGFSDKVCFLLQLGRYCLGLYKYSPGRCWVWLRKGDPPTHKKLCALWVRHGRKLWGSNLMYLMLGQNPEFPWKPREAEPQAPQPSLL